jgi:Glycosyl hydrolase family 1
VATSSYRLEGAVAEDGRLPSIEWPEGCRPGFGLVYIDFATQRRVLKDSGTAYADIIRTNRAGPAANPILRPTS